MQVSKHPKHTEASGDKRNLSLKGGEKSAVQNRGKTSFGKFEAVCVSVAVGIFRLHGMAERRILANTAMVFLRYWRHRNDAKFWESLVAVENLARSM
ncbi:hypothetical protein [Rhizobium bangladeshense]|uniref:Uncharacterized protein n=1 Tax=Rhizobium bangladeshense TaxID=1138189 RepID=A0ABS7LFZ0_9HYPH|nr:hypothetical protein [Rhizobium bangladeshense]MBX4875523.1 hypothetical protein [Rhizobium bangladeshense]MBX4886635.1 hypothetical protein [Rhizobium bangladeshense]MBX4890094.1 hypothetical protein [Rhizobium bangladeshense]MBX4894652.1 hypothetical protein [Rhizobium bangladeshense]MBX4914846.1 hypothetical protein [Rhizobium bangladeshense]